MDLAIIIVSYNTRKLLRPAWRVSLPAWPASRELDARIWVVDNASADGSGRWFVKRSRPFI